MDMSPVLKTSITDGNGLSNGVFFHLFSQNITEPYVPNPSKLVDLYDYAVTSLFTNLFATEDRYAALNNRLPFVRSQPSSNSIDPMAERQPAMGLIMSSVTDIDHGDTVSLACFNETLLRRFLVNVLGNDFGSSITNLINTTAIDQLGSVLGEALTNETNGGTVFTILIAKDPKLTISHLTQSELSFVENSWGGTPETPFFDAFDLVKERVTRQESFLNSGGFASAVYTDNGGDGSDDTIVFTGGYSLDIQTISTT
ncbi:hypothetical protein [Psychrobacter celer]|uniref:hypothetical protein n=1 Tax=Psychrobacter celer TaxID=306572 RepID=UPI003FD015E2